MKAEEVSKKFNIKLEELKYYESIGLFDDVKISNGVREYEDKDIEVLSKVVTLRNLELSMSEILRYIKLMKQGNDGDNERVRILNKQRNVLLDEVHNKQKSIDCLDCIIYKIKGGQCGKKEKRRWRKIVQNHGMF